MAEFLRASGWGHHRPFAAAHRGYPSLGGEHRRTAIRLYGCLARSCHVRHFSQRYARARHTIRRAYATMDTMPTAFRLGGERCLRWRGVVQCAVGGSGRWGALGRRSREGGTCGVFEVPCIRGRASPADESVIWNTRFSRANIGLIRWHPHRRLSAAHELDRTAATGRHDGHAA